MNLRVAICDDEAIIANDIKNRLLGCKPDYIADIYQSGKKLLESGQEYDLIFLDIEMQGMNGMETALKLRKNGYEGNLVFLTSHTEFMPEAFKVKAFRFLHKPIDEAAFCEAVNEAENEVRNNKKLLVNTSEGTMVISLKNILYLEASRNYTFIHMIHEEIETRKTLVEWMDILGSEEFYRVHRSYVISLRHIKTICRDGVVMNYLSVQIPVSRRRIGQLKDAYFDYVKNNAMFT